MRPRTMSDDGFFREVDEELRNDRVRSFWNRFGRYIIAAAVALVLVVSVLPSVEPMMSARTIS